MTAADAAVVVATAGARSMAGWLMLRLTKN